MPVSAASLARKGSLMHAGGHQAWETYSRYEVLHRDASTLGRIKKPISAHHAQCPLLLPASSPPACHVDGPSQLRALLNLFRLLPYLQPIR